MDKLRKMMKDNLTTIYTRHMDAFSTTARQQKRVRWVKHQWGITLPE